MTNDNYTDALAELANREGIANDDFLPEVEWHDVDLEGNWLDPHEAYTRPKFTLSYKGVPFAPLGGIHGLTGQPGHGKTFTFTQLMVAVLRGEYYGLRYELRDEIPEPRVLYIDTEMEKGNTQLVMLRVYDIMGWEKGSIHDNFRILWLREEVRAVDRWRKVLKAIQLTRPTVVFLDGLIDVIGDFNSNTECQEMIYQCMATASHYRISLWCLLHENPGSSKMVGHAGSFLERKATDVLKTQKTKEGGHVSFTVKQNKARSRDLDEWTFTIEDDANHYGHPVLGENESQDEKGIKDSDIEQWLRGIKGCVEWPATLRDIRKAISMVSGVRYNDILQEITEKIIGKMWIRPQDKSEYNQGQRYPKFYYNLVDNSTSMEDDTEDVPF